jgi:hypothetical protein
MGKVTKNAFFIIFSGLLALAGCFATPPTPEPPMPTHTPTSAPTASPTIMPVCTPPPCTADEVYFCPESCPGGCGTVCATVTPDPNRLAAVPATWGELATWLADAWQAQTELPEYLRLLQETGWLQNNDDWLAVDLDGDGRSEWALLLYQPDQEPISPHNLWVINGSGLIYQFYDEPNLIAGYSLKLQLTGTADLTGDGRAELIINEESCGAHTCFGNYQVLAADNDTLSSIVSHLVTGSRIEMSYPDTRFTDYTQDGLVDFIVHGGQIGSAGAGIVRPYTQVWAWDGTAVTLADTILDNTPYRHHILYEANDLMAANELESALLLYEQTINDGDLIESPFAGDDAETYAAISQFSAFRLILIDLMQGNNENAHSRQAWLNTTYPATAAADAAAILINNWTGLDSMAAACTAVESTMETYTNPTGVLLDQGYGNPSLTAADFCP